MNEPTEITLAAYRHLTGGRKTAKKPPRAGIPRAPADARVGLTPLLVAGWSLTFDVRHGFRLTYYRDAMTGWHADLKTVCDEAKQLQKERK